MKFFHWTIKDNPEKGQGIKLFDRGSNVAYNLIVVDNCPLGPALKFAARNAMETGTLGPVVNSWIGKEVGKVNVMHNGSLGYVFLEYKSLIPGKTNSWPTNRPRCS